MKINRLEELLNTLTHLLSGIIGIFLVPVLLKKVPQSEHLAIFIYMLGLIFMFMSSGIYHCLILFTPNSESRFYQGLIKIFQKIDHTMIFWFIMASYIPFTVALNTKLANIVFLIVALFCLIGIILKFFYAGRFKKVSTFMYIVIGWAALIELQQLYMGINHFSFWMLVLGGIIYSLGALIYAFAKIKYAHVYWHLFVMAGCFCQFIAVYYLYV